MWEEDELVVDVSVGLLDEWFVVLLFDESFAALLLDESFGVLL